MFLNLLRGYFQKYALLWLGVFCCVVFFATSFIYVQLLGNTPSGDEPHFLIISQTLLKYHSLDVMLDYRNGDYHLFYPIAIAPHVAYSSSGQLLPLHSIGGPVLWLIPFYFLGRMGAVLFISLVTVLIIVNIYLFLLVMGIRKRYAFVVSLAYAIASPLFIYSHLTFIEPIGAFICIYVLRKIFQDDLKASDLLVCSGLLGILPWVHIRFALFEMVLFFALLYRVYEQNGLKNVKYYIYYLLPVTVLFIVFEIYNYKVWGTFNPTVNEVNDIHGNNKPFEVAPFRGILGVFFDQEYGLIVNFPLFIFLFVGVVLAIKRKFMRYNLLMLVLSVPYVILFTTFKSWAGGWGPPARFILILLPLYSFYVGYALEQINNVLSSLVLGVAIVYGFIYNVLSVIPLLSSFNSGTGRNRALDRVQVFNHHLTDFFPSLFLPGQAWLFIAWIGVCAGLCLMLLCSSNGAKNADTSIG